MPGLGWDPKQAVRAQARMIHGGVYATVGASSAPHRPAVSLSHLRSRILVQGNAGTCWCHSPAQLFEVTARAMGYAPFPACRRAIGYEAKELYEGGGNMADGGSPTDAITVMTGQGIGVAHEDLCPYSDDPKILAQSPPKSAFDDAKMTHLIAPVHVKSFDEIITMIDSGKPVANGFACPDGFKRSDTFLDSVGSIMGGHSVLIWGYALSGVIDDHRWLECENWWGSIYQPLGPALSRKVEGYEPARPGQATSKWVREDIYIQLCNMAGGCEHVSATDLEGLGSGAVVPASDPNTWFPV